MRVFNRIAAQPSGVLVGMVVASALMVVTFGLAVAGSRVLASHDDPAVVHTCVSQFTGQARFVPAGQEPDCNGSGVLDELAALRSQVDDLATETDEQAQRIEELETATNEQAQRIEDLETENASQNEHIGDLETTVTILEDDLAEQDERIGEIEEALDGIDVELPTCLTTDGDDVVFEGCNVHIRNGAGSTGTTNGTGNLIIGYNENTNGRDRTGSHNLVVGAEHGYSRYGGLVAGFNNVISGAYASVSGGLINVASAGNASVSGGFNNTAEADNASVSGGSNNTASGENSSVSGGRDNGASGTNASVSGGDQHVASGTSSSVSGGLGNEAGGSYSSISGGFENTTSGPYSSVGGGTDVINNNAGEFHAEGMFFAP